MEKSNKRGKIPQSDWPLIMARYDAGETLASIARTYDCSPPAISYVVSRSRARQPGPEAPAAKPSSPPEPQLIKAVAGAPGEGAGGVPPRPPAQAVPDLPVLEAPPPAHEARPETTAAGNGQRDPEPPRPGNGQRDPEPPRPGNGFLRNGSGGGAGNGAAARAAAPATPWQRPAAAAAPPNGDQRRTLHLSLGAPPHGNGGAAPANEPPPAERTQFANRGQPMAGPADRAGNGGGAEPAPTAHHEAARHSDAPAPQRREPGSSGAFIDRELRTRVEGDIAAFLAAFDDALAQDTPESRTALREATDRLLRAGARTRIELERLEARLPLPPRDGTGRGNGGNLAWRDR
jgi:hypothetical protein